MKFNEKKKKEERLVLIFHTCLHICHCVDGFIWTTFFYNLDYQPSLFNINQKNILYNILYKKRDFSIILRQIPLYHKWNLPIYHAYIYE